MMRASWKAYVLSFLVLGGGVAVLRASYTPASRDSRNPGEDRKVSYEEVQRQVRDQNLQVARSEESAVFIRRDIAEIERRLSEVKSDREITRLFKAGIYLLDREALKSYTEEERERLYRAVLGYVTENRAGARGKSAQAAGLAIRLLGKLPEPAPTSASRKGMLELLDPVNDPRRSMLVLEALTRWKTLPPEGRARLERDLASSDAHTSRTAIGLIAQLRDAKAKAALLNLMVERYPGLPELTRPLAFKVWVMFRELIKKDFSRELAKAKEREGDYWEDAAVSAIERLGVSPEHDNYLRSLHSRTTNPLTQKRISALLGRMPAKQGGSQ